MTTATNIQTQLNKIIKGNPTLNVVKPCRLGDGILALTPQDKNKYLSLFESSQSQKNITFFIPSSGSGSRMFGALYDFVENKNLSSQTTIEFIEQLLNNIERFSFYNKLPQTFKDSLKDGQIDIDALVKYIIFDHGLNFGSLPKGLIPFHLYGKFMINPFQEQILQGTKLAGEKVNFHFTINPKFEKEITHTIEILKEITGIDFYSTFSYQDEATHSTAFTNDNSIAVSKDGSPILRPSGHGALINNLNKIDSDLIFIKNIDNIQHSNKAQKSLQTKKILAGILLDFQTKVFSILSVIEKNDDGWLTSLKALKTTFKLCLTESQLNDKKYITTYLNRPIRVCGMVKNEGQAGGGPFWVKDNNGVITQQIIEKSQINHNQLSVVLHATHFNPVDIVCGVKNYKNQKFDLTKYVNSNYYFIVNKTQDGQPIKYIEQPGLWNGGMYNWLTIFQDIDSNCFSPVKTVLDLLKPLHLEK